MSGPGTLPHAKVELSGWTFTPTDVSGMVISDPGSDGIRKRAEFNLGKISGYQWLPQDTTFPLWCQYDS